MKVARLLWRAHPAQATVFALLVLLRSLSPLAFAVASAVLVASVPEAVDDGSSSAAAHRATTALVAMVVAFVVQQTTPTMVLDLGYILGGRLTHELDQQLMAAAVTPEGIQHLEDPAVADRLAAARDAVAGWLRPGDVVHSLAGRAALHIGIWSGSLLLLAFHWWAAVAVLLIALVLQSRVATAMQSLGAGWMGGIGPLREAGYLTGLGLGPTAAKEVRVFGLGGWLVDRHVRAWQTASDMLTDVRSQGQRGVRRAAATMGLAIALVLCLLGWEATQQDLSLAAVVLTLQGLALVAANLADPAPIKDGLFLGFATAALDSATSLERDLSDRVSALPGHGPAAGLPREEIRFTQVDFRYSGGDHQVLSGLDLIIPAGTSLGLVGLNGAGKTTLLKLLCRLYEPTGGTISIDGADLRELDATQWQRRIAAVFQDYVRYPFSVAENIALHEADRAQLEAVGNSVGLTSLIASLPRGWDTPLVSSAPGGVDLSGGQWQRVALARALHAARAGSSVLVLDEPTAALDVRAEAAIYESFLELTEGLTTILISHRLSSVRRADRIAVLEHGKVVELGSHDELVALGGRYAELFRLQASAFQREDAPREAAP